MASMTELQRRLERRRSGRNYKPVALSAQQPVVNVSAPHVSVTPSPVNVESKELDLAPIIEVIDRGLERLCGQLKTEISRPRKVVVDKDGEPIGTVPVEKL